jgi:antitoxin component YwqK of YwqJK toxin-antitoxin module
MKGYTSSVEKLIKEGSFIYYYQNGLKESIANYKENRLVGKEFKWYDNGNKQSDGEYILASDPFEPSIFVLNQYWSKNGQQKVIDGEGDYEESDDLFFLSGKISKGQNTGEWKGENKKEKIKFVEIYHDGNLVSGVSIDSSSVKYNYYKVMIQPRPKKGLGHFYKYIGSKFRIPKGFEKINGEIFLTFIIGKDGDARDVKIIKSLGEDIDNEAIRIIKSYPDWSPGVYRGIKINTLYSIPIKVVAGE